MTVTNPRNRLLSRTFPLYDFFSMNGTKEKENIQPVATSGEENREKKIDKLSVTGRDTRVIKCFVINVCNNYMRYSFAMIPKKKSKASRLAKSHFLDERKCLN